MTRIGAWLYRLLGYRKFQHAHRWLLVSESAEWQTGIFQCECGSMLRVRRKIPSCVTISGGRFDCSDVNVLLYLTRGDLQVGDMPDAKGAKE